MYEKICQSEIMTEHLMIVYKKQEVVNSYIEKVN